MSHVVKGKIGITDLNALKEACNALGLIFREGQKVAKSYSNIHDCDHVILVPGATYEIGLKRNQDVYELSYDPWKSGGLEKVLGENLGKLTQEYSAQVVSKKMQNKGWYVIRQQSNKQQIILRCMKG